MRSGADDLRLIVGSERVRVVTRNAADHLAVLTEVRLEEVAQCAPLSEDDRWYVELLVAGERRPRIRCDTEEIARYSSCYL